MQPAEAAVATVAQTLAGMPGLRWGYVFGSVVRGGSFRDVDVAVMPGPGLPPGAVVWGQMVAALETAVGRPVDLIDLSAAELPFVGPLLAERRVVLDREPSARRTWETQTTGRWLDFQPSWQEQQRVRALAMQRRLAGDS